MMIHFFIFYLCSAVAWETAAGGQIVVEGIEDPSATISPAVASLRQSTSFPNISLTVSPRPSLLPGTSLESPVSQGPSFESSGDPSTWPSLQSFNSPTNAPTILPSEIRSRLPSTSPTNHPTISFRPSFRPSLSPSYSVQPSDWPSSVPSLSALPSTAPSGLPTQSILPSKMPIISGSPSISMEPSFSPSGIPSLLPSHSQKPSLSPSLSHAPSASFAPSKLSSSLPSDAPSNTPSLSLIPSAFPSWPPTSEPSVTPSDEPSSLPSATPSYTPQFAVRDVGLYVTGLVDVFKKGSNKSRQFENLVNKHTKFYWLNASNGGSIVYNATAEFITILRPPRDWKRDRMMQQHQSSSTRLGAEGRQASPIISNDTDSNVALSNQTFPSEYESENSTLAVAPFEGWNETGGNYSDINESRIPTTSPTATLQPSLPPSKYLSFSPSFSQSPSTAPSVSAQPSTHPSSLPLFRTWVIWYRQEIVYGERLDTNDVRANTVDEIFEFPFILDQMRFTNELIEITENQLAIFVDVVEVRDGSEAPSIQPSEAPSAFPSAAVSSSPTPPPTSRGTGGVSTTTVIVAVVVPVMLVLLIAFAGIIYVTRIENDVLAPGGSFEGEVISLPPDQQGPGTPAGGSTPPSDGVNGNGQQSALSTFPVGTQPTLGSQPASPLMEPSKEMTAHSLTRPPAFQSNILRDTSSRTTEHPIDFVSPPRRTTSNAGSMISEMSVDSRRAAAYTPAFTPTLASVPSPGSANSHSRASSFQGSSSIITLGRSGLARATTGGMLRVSSNGRLSPVGQISPSQCSRGGIPTIAAAQVSLATDAAVLRGNVQHDVEVVSESDAELEPPSMAAFNLQIQDLDDF